MARIVLISVCLGICGCVAVSAGTTPPPVPPVLLAQAPDSASNGCLKNPLLCGKAAAGEEPLLCPPYCLPVVPRSVPSEDAICGLHAVGNSEPVLCDYDCEGVKARISLPQAMTRCPGADGGGVPWATMRQDFTVLATGSAVLPSPSMMEVAAPKHDQICKPTGSGGVGNFKSPFTCRYECGQFQICVEMLPGQSCPESKENGAMSYVTFEKLKKYRRCK